MNNLFASITSKKILNTPNYWWDISIDFALVSNYIGKNLWVTLNNM